MKKILLFTIASCVCILFSFATTHTNDVAVNTKSSKVKWTGSKPTGSHYGNVNISSGKLVFDHGTFVGGEFILDMNTIETKDIESERKRNYLTEHLKNEDFFNVEEFPTSSLKIISAEATPEPNFYKVLAELTIKDITHVITFGASVTYRANNFLAQAKIKIDRTKWDVVYKSGNVFKDLGDKIIHDEIEFDVFLISEK